MGSWDDYDTTYIMCNCDTGTGTSTTCVNYTWHSADNTRQPTKRNRVPVPQPDYVDRLIPERILEV